MVRTSKMTRKKNYSLRRVVAAFLFAPGSPGAF
uniref:Uncharacterized protein n=1 Tax=Myoviridae sp. ct5Tq8 TaxID=2826612 RepID=A0A8S5NDQ8_9CAUD|nr:MAG TPA: hypothetical protein [Myoviridae sp. ct5Tq8]DAF24964.1 MAG TPA: hypothetical protein [Caudoviricetes sp.]DAT20218.1 MAG TPA: hypothetical protein [Caudoviricetes sp.]